MSAPGTITLSWRAVQPVGYTIGVRTTSSPTWSTATNQVPARPKVAWNAEQSAYDLLAPDGELLYRAPAPPAGGRRTRTARRKVRRRVNELARRWQELVPMGPRAERAKRRALV